MLKLGLFCALWYELAVELGLSADASLIAALALVFGWRLALSLLGQTASMIGPVTAGLLAQIALWIGLLWFLLPGVFSLFPLVADALIVIALALAGARARVAYERRRQMRGAQTLQDYSGTIIAAVFGGLFACAASLQLTGSLWPLAGYALLPILPLRFGWQMAALAAPRDRADARFGDAASFHDAGMSENR